MASYETKGTIIRVGKTEAKGAKGFLTRTLVLEVEDGKFPQTVEFQATGDRCAQLDEHGAGDSVNIKWNLRGREWAGGDKGPRIFNSLDVWKVESLSKAPRATSIGSPDTDELPF